MPRNCLIGPRVNRLERDRPLEHPCEPNLAEQVVDYDVSVLRCCYTHVPFPLQTKILQKARRRHYQS